MGNSLFDVTSRFYLLSRDAILTNHLASFNTKMEQYKIICNIQLRNGIMGLWEPKLLGILLNR
jgi:hypothetical protein